MDKIADVKLYKPRIMDKVVQHYLQVFGAVCIEGPKWCGKTWISSFHSNSEFLVADSERDFQNKRLAQMSAHLVLEGETPRLLDEWQEVPSLWDAVRYEVDKRGKRGQFVLTGSSTPKLIDERIHSGAGRMGKLRMRTMSLFESGESVGVVSLKDLCEGKLRPAMTGEVSLWDLADYVVRGGFPSSLDLPAKDAQLIAFSYIDSLLNVDLPKLVGSQYNFHKMKLLLCSLARNESTTVSTLKLVSDINEVDHVQLDYDTVTKYLDVFERLFLTDNQRPFATTVRSSVRLKQSEKRHFCDPSLACALLNLSSDKLINDLKTFGFMFEALCVRDLKVYAGAFGAQVFHYQDYSNKEVDAVVELQDGSWCAFEIKLGANQIDAAAKNLLCLKNKIETEGGKVPSVLCVICGLSNAAYQRPDGVFVVPITALKD